MDKDLAFKILIEAIDFAQSKGIYTIKDSSKILEAIEAFTEPNNLELEKKQNTTIKKT